MMSIRAMTIAASRSLGVVALLADMDREVDRLSDCVLRETDAELCTLLALLLLLPPNELRLLTDVVWSELDCTLPAPPDTVTNEADIWLIFLSPQRRHVDAGTKGQGRGRSVSVSHLGGWSR
jgi:hypothetical protein